MFENLTNNMIIAIMCVTGVIILASLILLILVIKEGDGNPKVKKEKVKKSKNIEQIIKEEVTEKPVEEPKKQKVSYKKARTIEEHAQDEKNETSIEEVLNAINVDLENKKDSIDVYEDDQEEHAIISYSELLNKKKSLELPVESEPKKIIETPKEEVYTNRKVAPDISPIFGRTNENPDVSKKIKIVVSEKKEETQSDFDLNFDENDDFLNSLKDFRNNL